MAQGGSLFGRADATLVGAALKESMANLPANLTAVYAKREQNLKDFSKGIQEAFDIYYADYNNTSELLKTNSQAVLNNLETGGVLNPYLLEQNNNVVNGFKQRLRSIPAGRQGDLERSKLRHEMNVYAQRNAANEVIFQNLAENTANGSILDDFGPQGSEKRKLLNLMMEDYNNGTSKTQRQYVNGDFVYSLPGSNIKMTMKDLQNSLSVYDASILSEVQKDLNLEQQNGKRGLPFNSTQFYNKLRGKMKSNNDIDNISKERFGDMPFSFDEYLRGAGAGTREGNEVASYLMDALNGIGGIDVTGDGVVKQEDINIYSDPKNAAVLSQAILGDPGVKKELTALYITKYAAEDAHSLGRGLIRQPGSSSKPSNTSFGNKNLDVTGSGVFNVKGTALDNIAQRLSLKAEFDFGSQGKFNWDENKNTYIFKGPDGKEQKVPNKKTMLQMLLSVENLSPQFQLLPAYQNMFEWGTSDSKDTDVNVNVNDLIDFEFIKMTEEDAEKYLRENLPDEFSYEKYGLGDAITVKYGDDSVDINLQPNTTSGERAQIKKLQDFINTQLGGAGSADNL